MTGTSLTYLAAQEHVNDLLREAESSRRAAESRPTRRVKISLPRLFRRRGASLVEPQRPVIAAQSR